MLRASLCCFHAYDFGKICKINSRCLTWFTDQTDLTPNQLPISSFGGGGPTCPSEVGTSATVRHLNGSGLQRGKLKGVSPKKVARRSNNSKDVPKWRRLARTQLTGSNEHECAQNELGCKTAWQDSTGLGWIFKRILSRELWNGTRNRARRAKQRKRRSKVYMQCGVLEADMRKEWLAHQVLWELLRLRCSNAILIRQSAKEDSKISKAWGLLEP